MIGIRCGITAGISAGIGVGTSPGAGGGGGIPGVTRDATSSKYRPANTSEWTALMTAAVLATGNPSSTWPMQEASGNLADSIGTVTLTAAGASLLYRQAVAGWSSLALTIPDGLANHNAQNTTTCPDISLTSVMLLLYVRMPAAAPAATRRFLRLDSTGVLIPITTMPRLQCTTGGVGGTTVTGASDPTGGAVRPVVVVIDRTGGRAVLYTDQEKIIGTVGTYTGIVLGIGSSGGNSADSGFLYGAAFSGASAELSDAQVKTLLVTLGWSIPWT